jgi:hypothetical protein
MRFHALCPLPVSLDRYAYAHRLGGSPSHQIQRGNLDVQSVKKYGHSSQDISAIFSLNYKRHPRDIRRGALPSLSGNLSRHPSLSRQDSTIRF